MRGFKKQLVHHHHLYSNTKKEKKENLPLRTTETERIRQLPSQRLPEKLLLVLIHLDQIIIVLLQLLIFLDNLRIANASIIATGISTSFSTAAVAAFATLSVTS